MNVSTNESAARAGATKKSFGAQMLKATLTGVLLSAVLGWTLLSFALSLPFFLGLFFFMLFGMVIGAAMFRFAAPVRPIVKSRIVRMTAIATFVAWSVALAKESIDYPDDFVTTALKNKSLYIPKGNEAYERARSELAAFIDEYLEKQYPPGGAIGYLRLAAGGRSIPLDIPNQVKEIKIDPPAAAWAWWTRVILSAVLMFVTVYAVTTDLAKESDTPRPKGGRSEMEKLDDAIAAAESS